MNPKTEEEAQIDSEEKIDSSLNTQNTSNSVEKPVESELDERAAQIAQAYEEIQKKKAAGELSDSEDSSESNSSSSKEDQDPEMKKKMHQAEEHIKNMKGRPQRIQPPQQPNIESITDNLNTPFKNEVDDENGNPDLVKSSHNSYADKEGFIGPKRPRSEELYRLKLIGTGNFSSIYLVEEYFTKKLTALKEYPKHEVERRRKTADLVMEKYVLEKLKDCDRVCKMIETCKDAFNIYFHMEWMEGGELWKKLRVFGLPSRAEIKYYFYKILLAVKEIHSKGIIHRDLKPENIMLNKEGTDLKLIDFATAWDHFDPSKKGSGNSSTGRRIFYHYIGTPQYMSIENVRNRGSYFASDIYSMGCILYQMIAGYTPYLGPGEYTIFQKTDKGLISFYDFFSEQEKELITGMTKREHTERLTLEQVLEHPYFQDAPEVYSSVVDDLSELEALRTAEEAFLHKVRTDTLAELKKFENDGHPYPSAPRTIEEAVNKDLPLNHPDNVKEDPYKKERLEIIKKGVGIEIPQELQSNSSKESSNPEFFNLASRLKHLKKQLMHFSRLKDFEHYY